MIEESELKGHLRAIRSSGHWDALMDVILDLAGRAQKRINVKLLRGKPLVAEDWPEIQLDQGKLQGLQELADDLTSLSREEKEEPKPQTRAMDV